MFTQASVHRHNSHVNYSVYGVRIKRALCKNDEKTLYVATPPNDEEQQRAAIC